MKGLKFYINKDKKEETQYGWDKIEVINEYVYRERIRGGVIYYYYMLDCICTEFNDTDKKTFAQIKKDELYEEIVFEIYNLGV